jgi:hypothetical protein
MSNVSSKALNQRSARVHPGKLGALIAQFVSWLTTYWCVLWIMQPTPEMQPIAVLVSLLAELLLVLMKRCLFNTDRNDDAIGWSGLIIDAIINAGGILPRAGRLLTFPPIAAILAFFGVSAADPTVNSIGAFVVAAIAGGLLSVLPHRLWRSNEETR